MPARPTHMSSKQAIFRDMVLGTLLYAVVMGFFADYTDVLDTRSYSITFLAAVVMQILTFLTFALKDQAVAWFARRTGPLKPVALALVVWLIMFLSKFVFLWVIDLIFGPAVEISGFIGLLLMIIVMTIAKQLIDLVYRRLAD